MVVLISRDLEADPAGDCLGFAAAISRDGLRLACPGSFFRPGNERDFPLTVFPGGSNGGRRTLGTIEQTFRKLSKPGLMLPAQLSAQIDNFHVSEPSHR